MPHVTGHFCVCHVELWLLFHDFFPCTPVYRVPGYLGTWENTYVFVRENTYTFLR